MDPENTYNLNFNSYYNDMTIPVTLQSNSMVEELKMNIFSFIENVEYSDVKLILENYGDLENFSELPLSCLDLSII